MLLIGTFQVLVLTIFIETTFKLNLHAPFKTSRKQQSRYQFTHKFHYKMLLRKT